MKHVIAILAMVSIPSLAFAERMCDVQICNKLERVTLDPWRMMKDQFGESCFNTTVPESIAVRGKILDSQSRWYQGSFNPTKRSVTRVNKVYVCK